MTNHADLVYYVESLNVQNTWWIRHNSIKSIINFQFRLFWIIFLLLYWLKCGDRWLFLTSSVIPAVMFTSCRKTPYGCRTVGPDRFRIGSACDHRKQNRGDSYLFMFFSQAESRKPANSPNLLSHFVPETCRPDERKQPLKLHYVKAVQHVLSVAEQGVLGIVGETQTGNQAYSLA